MAILVGCWLLDALASWATTGDPITGALLAVKEAYWRFFKEILPDPFLIFGLPIAFLLQYLTPVQKQEPAFGAATRADAVYFVWELAMLLVLIPAQWQFLRFVYDTFFSYCRTPDLVQ